MFMEGVAVLIERGEFSVVSIFRFGIGIPAEMLVFIGFNKWKIAVPVDGLLSYSVMAMLNENDNGGQSRH